jgi:MFS family permease
MVPPFIHKLIQLRSEYPRQFWLMFFGMLLSTSGASMIWPFLMIYVSERLLLPMTVVASLTTISAVAGLISSFIAGPIIDRVGRKGVMVVSLILNAAGFFFMSQAESLGFYAILMAVNGAFNPLYRIGADAMMADIIPPEKRPDAFSLLRMSNNLGVAIGPSIGGFLATASYNLAFYFAAGGLFCYGMLIAFFARETLPKTNIPRAESRLGGYDVVLRDRPYIAFISNFIFVMISASIMWVLLAVYAKHNYGLPENKFGFIPATNAIMIVLFQYGVTQITKKYPTLPVVTVGAFFYAIAVAGVALSGGFWSFWMCMVVMTIGELIIIPPSSTYVANHAPADMRGRYMSLYTLSWGIAAGIGPVVGGLLNDNLGPKYIWWGGGMIGLIGVTGLFIMSYRYLHSIQKPSV